MTEPRKCPACGAALPVRAVEGLCPKCLLGAGLEASMPDQVPDAEAPTLPPSDASHGPVSLTGPTPLGKVRYFGDYELLEEIARGGMGVVYKARQVKLNRIVAVKMILAGQLASEADVKRFYTEAEAAANLQHPNIVAIHEVGEHEGRHYFSMDYVDGKSLAAVVGGMRMPAVKAAGCVKTLAEAVHFAHLRGILHRDLKPSNVLIDAAEQPHITDFGLAKQIEKRTHLTQTGAVLGTPSYMPPEQAAGNRGEVGPPSDVYSLGAILFELLTGRPPFQASNVMDTLIQVLEDDPPSPRKLNPQVPPDLETICLKCLEKRRERRYPSARELAEELGRFLNHQPIHARRAGRVRRVWSWAKRKPWAITAGVSLIVLGLSTMCYWLWAENGYLRWQLTEQASVYEPGSLTRKSKAVQWIAIFLIFGLMFAYYGLAWFFARQKREGRSIPGLLFLGAALLGSAGVSIGALLLIKSIDARVWDGASIVGALPMVYFLCSLGGGLVWRAVQTYEYFEFGSSRPIRGNFSEVGRKLVSDLLFGSSPPIRGELTEVDLKTIFDLMTKRADSGIERERYRLAAIKLYRERTEQDLDEATLAVNQLETTLHQRFPEGVPADFQPNFQAIKVGRGCLLAILLPLLLLVLVPVCMFALLVGGPHTLAGLLTFGCTAAILTRRDGKPLRKSLLIALFGLVAVVLFVLPFLYPLRAVLIGSVVGVAFGIVLSRFVPMDRITAWIKRR